MFDEYDNDDNEEEKNYLKSLPKLNEKMYVKTLISLLVMILKKKLGWLPSHPINQNAPDALENYLMTQNNKKVTIKSSPLEKTSCLSIADSQFTQIRKRTSDKSMSEPQETKNKKQKNKIKFGNQT